MSKFIFLIPCQFVLALIVMIFGFATTYSSINSAHGKNKEVFDLYKEGFDPECFDEFTLLNQDAIQANLDATRNKLTVILLWFLVPILFVTSTVLIILTNSACDKD